ncbi:MAG: ATP-binding protein [Roseobacter sp.]|uniref:ATP-binding protein n=1 Tax=Hyphomonas sp. TaxID=87 RepID=UPI003299EF64
MINVQSSENVSFETIEPDAAALIESLRDIGYTMPTAVADIVDNSLTANASHISIRVNADPDHAAVAVIDDGDGMSASELLEAMKPGSRTPTETRHKHDLGRFGLGLKTASFSQCRRLTVVTSRKGVRSTAIWDLDLVVKKNAWIVERRNSDEDIRYADLVGTDGTLVLWEKLDRAGLELGDQTLLRLLDETSKHLELVFHRFMKSEPGHGAIIFNVNGHKLEPSDPFAEWHDATIRQPQDRRQVAGGTAVIQAFILPHRNKVMSETEWKRMGLAEGHMRSQGFYLYRNRRLIRHATWFRMAPQHRLTQLARVKIDIGNESDAAWKIDVLKASASPPPALRNHLRQMIEGLGGKSKRVYRKRGAKLTEENPFPLWQRTKVNDTISYSLNSDHPFVSQFENSLTDLQSREFQELMRLFSAGLPLEALQHDMADNFEAVKQEVLDDTEMRSSCRILIEQLRTAEHNDREITKILSLVPPYSGAKKIVEELVNERKENE